MPAYIIADVKVTNPAGYEPYRPLAAASIARFGGRFLVRGGKAELLEGAGEPERTIVIEFPDAGPGTALVSLRRIPAGLENPAGQFDRPSDPGRGRLTRSERAPDTLREARCVYSRSSPVSERSRRVGKPARLSALIKSSTCRRFWVSTTTSSSARLTEVS